MQVDTFGGIGYRDGMFNTKGGTKYKVGSDKIRDNIIFLLRQEKGKFYPDPEFGSELQKYMFEPMTKVLGQRMQNEVQTLIAKYYPQINVINVNVSMYSAENRVNIEIEYTYSDSYTDIETIALDLFNTVNA